MERARGRKFAEFVTDHVLRDKNRHEFAAVVNGKRLADEVRRDRRTTRPRLDHLSIASLDSDLDLALEVPVDKGSLFY